MDELRGHLLSEISQSQKDKNTAGFHLHEISKLINIKLIASVSETVVTRD